MECLFALTGKDFVLVASDTSAARSITVMKSNEDKTRPLTDHAIMAFAGEPGDAVQFAEYVQKNLKLYALRNGIEPNPKAVASYTRREMADSLRSRNAYHVNLLIGGYDPRDQTAHLYWLDYLASSAKVPFAAHGYGAYYLLSLMDRYHRPDITLEEGKAILRKCVEELRRRFIINLPAFSVKLVDAEGIKEVQL
ncbi:uncharacterized protein VTP21DRAFT_4202 [Calcarisporiella thermophila]|uniref:uncharacterized protein n=1 Tax=Calcarisporiella thermophila TaxID=911321 RepID=UPI0037422280